MAEAMARRQMIAALHVAKRDRGLDDDTYRAALERATGKSSAATMDEAELKTALRALAPPGKKTTMQPHHALAKALWIAMWNLGAIEHGDDRALDGFAKRQTGKERLVFTTSAEANAITEALKAIGARHGFTLPANDKGGMGARMALVRAQWKRLAELGAVRVPEEAALMWWARNQQVIGNTRHITQWKRQELDLAAKKLGTWLRGVLKRRGPDVP